MTATSQIPDLHEKLRSLVIEREPEPSSSPEPETNWPARRLSWFAVILLAGSGVAVAGFWASGLRSPIMPSAGTVSSNAAQISGKTVVATAGDGSDGAVAPGGKREVSAVSPAVMGTGYVVAPRIVEIKPRVAGTISEIDVAVGDRVRDGQVIIRMDERTARLALAVARSNVASAHAKVTAAEASLKAAEAPVDRLEKLVPRGVESLSSLQDKRLAAAQLASEVEVERRQLDTASLEAEQAQDQLDKYVIRAPFDAYVVSLDAAPGLVVPSGEVGGNDNNTLMTLVDSSRLFVDVDIAEKEISAIRTGQKAQVVLDAYPDRTIPAVVRTVEPSASRQKGTVTVRLSLVGKRHEGILPNMAAKVTFSPTPETKPS